MRGVKPKRPCRKAQAAKDPLQTPRHTKPLVFLPCLVWGCQRERKALVHGLSKAGVAMLALAAVAKGLGWIVRCHSRCHYTH